MGNERHFSKIFNLTFFEKDIDPLKCRIFYKECFQVFCNSKLLTNVVPRFEPNFFHCIVLFVCVRFILQVIMPSSRRVSERQLELLLDFVEANRDIALGRCTRGPLASQITQQSWETLKHKLNAVTDGVTKTAEQWRRYWIDWKAKTKAKGADNRRSALKTGGGPNRLIPLTELERRILQLIGTVSVEGLPEVRIPFPVPSHNPVLSSVSQTYIVPSTSQSQPSTSHSKLTTTTTPLPEEVHPMEVEWLEDEDYFYLEKLPTQPLLSQVSPQPTPSTPPQPTPSTPPQPTPSTPPQPTPSTPPHPTPSPCPQSSPTPSAPSRQLQSLPSFDRQPPSPQRPAQPSQRPRSRRQRLICNRDVPQWARSLEERRLAIEERHARALEALSATLANIEARLRDISDKLSK